MTIKPYRFEVSEARSVKHPTLPNIVKHTFLVPAHLFPKEVPNGANLRDPVDTNRQVYKDVKASLEGKEALPGTFDLLNLGITIIAEDVEVIDKDNVPGGGVTLFSGVGRFSFYKAAIIAGSI